MGFNKMQTIANRLLDDHIADAVKHITAAERAAWNAKPDSSHTHDKLVKGSYEVTLPTLTKNEVFSLVGHSHAIDDITGLAEKLTSMLHWKGSCTKTQLTAKTAATGNVVGDVWCVTDESNKEYAWNGTAWEEIGMNVDMTLYAEKLKSGKFTAGHIAVIGNDGSFSDTNIVKGGATLADTTDIYTLATEKAVEAAISGLQQAWEETSGIENKATKVASTKYTVGNLAKLVSDGVTGKGDIADSGFSVNDTYSNEATGTATTIPTTKYAVNAAKYEADKAASAVNTALDSRLDVLEAVTHHVQKFVSANTSAATVLADLKSSGMKVSYSVASAIQIVLPVGEDTLKGRSPEVEIILNPGTYSVTISDGTNTEVLTADASGFVVYTFGIIMTSTTSYSWVMFE